MSNFDKYGNTTIVEGIVLAYQIVKKRGMTSEGLAKEVELDEAEKVYVYLAGAPQVLVLTGDDADAWYQLNK